ncbi:hypothetical protein ACLIN3_27590 (plasmid) [Pseudomonas orientalis]|uniref:hypothetical protein n=1 Tax=Pseudomonas orientalis TaxID=76758 RepID=UPI00398617D5
MSKSTLKDTLQEMAEAPNGRSETSRLRAVFPDIERALAAGVRRQNILDALHKDGFTMNMKTFEKALYRIRKSAKKKATAEVSDSSATAVSTAQRKTRGEMDLIPRKGDNENPRKPVTRTDLREIRNSVNNLDLNALVKGKGLVNRE